ncbi:helix-turn-helix domain-containing protein [Bacillus toyonensis]|uniref:helix-turn-helix domain-containing protein n=1 Tax=Bacillus toyonensis TaxID=155322 RepID=UPI000BFCA621|nr:transcriptional regulator [Bacillus toyonensis]
MKLTVKQISANGKLARELTEKNPQQPIYDKNDFTDEKGFIKTPAQLKHYTDLYPYGITTDAMWVYQLIVDWYNREDGSAYPSQYVIARRIRKSVATVKKHISALRSVGLIAVQSRGIGRSNLYLPLKPLDNHTMYERFPLAKQFAEEHEALIDKYEGIDRSTIESNKKRQEEKAERQQEDGADYENMHF